VDGVMVLASALSRGPPDGRVKPEQSRVKEGPPAGGPLHFGLARRV
jgi:hypothetical protein